MPAGQESLQNQIHPDPDYLQICLLIGITERFDWNHCYKNTDRGTLPGEFRSGRQEREANPERQ